MFFIDSDFKISYKQLIEAVNTGKHRTVFTSFVADLIDSRDICLLNYSLSPPIKNRIGNKSQLLHVVSKSNSKITMKTSGTTGQPNSFVHCVQNIFANSKIKKEKCIWLFTYNKFHMGGFQVFMQAILSGDTIVYGYKKSRQEIIDLIKNNSVTHISATPTFYRLLLPLDDKIFSVKRVTMGGERSDSTLLEAVKFSFPNSKINNIYATTEAGAVLFSKDCSFQLNHKTKVIDNILFVKSNNEWHNTGDFVRFIEDDKFVFEGRNKKIINLGGRNVNPDEIEDVARQSGIIKDIFVYSKSNRLLGNVLKCDVVLKSEFDLRDFKDYMHKNLEKFKIPRIINVKEFLKTTENNKVTS